MGVKLISKGRPHSHGANGPARVQTGTKYHTGRGENRPSEHVIERTGLVRETREVFPEEVKIG